MKLADITPTYCSACFQQNPQKKHIDFEAYWDGPVIDKENGVKQAIDDLVICADCLGAAAEVLGYFPRDKILKENYELGKACETKEETITKQNKIIGDMERTIETLLQDKKRGEIRRVTGQPVLRVSRDKKLEAA